ncbi:MAG: sulfur carrier protein ThiS [Alphaproteobacteria bacterium]|nr:sulfur carrier protein ThiS [Alphaproteobacteria bacterium]
MKLQVNGDAHDAPEGASLAQLLRQLGQPLEAVAVAVNLEVVPRGRYAERALAEGDRVEIVRAVGGG